MIHIILIYLEFIQVKRGDEFIHASFIKHGGKTLSKSVDIDGEVT